MFSRPQNFSRRPFLPRSLLGGPLLASEAPASGEDCHSEASHAAGDEVGADSSTPRVSGALDTVLLDERGERVSLARDVLEGRVVVMNFIFTTCTTICPPMGAHFGKLQRLLAEEGRSDVRLVSISIDPERDTPQRLVAWRERFGGTEGWTLLTGEKPRVDAVLKTLKVFTPLFEDHAPLALIGRGSPGDEMEWRRVHGLTPPAELMKLVAPLREAASESPPGPASDGGGTGR